MPANVLITGAPGIGKTTLVKHLLSDFRLLIVRGFYKEGIIEYGICKGFRTITFEYREQILAHIHIKGPERSGEYGVNVKGFEQLVLPELDLTQNTELILIDEIGRMEMKSKKFSKALDYVLDSNVPLIASVNNSYLSELNSLINSNIFFVKRS